MIVYTQVIKGQVAMASFIAMDFFLLSLCILYLNCDKFGEIFSKKQNKHGLYAY